MDGGGIAFAWTERRCEHAHCISKTRAIRLVRSLKNVRAAARRNLDLAEDEIDWSFESGRTNRNPDRVISSFGVSLAKQLEMKGCAGWGGKRKGAGRPNLSKLVSHAARVRVDFRSPLHVTMRLRKGIPNIRSKSVLKAFKICCARTKRFGFRVLHFAIQSNHIHLIVEADDNQALGRGMQSLASSFAKALKKLMATWKNVKVLAGAVFAGRYHLEKITNPTKMRNTLKYVLLNTSKHEKLIEFIDPFSSGFVFTQWKELLKREYRGMIKRQAENSLVSPASLGLSDPRSWLAREGWKRAVA